MKPLIFIVEDEEKIATILKTYIEGEGFSAQVLAHGDEVVEQVRLACPDLILLDLMLPGINGIDICKELRSFTAVPVIMVTAKVEEIDRLLGLEFGADDYICKPFSPREVVARVKTVLRRTQRPQEEPVVVTGLVLDEQNFKVVFNDISVDLTRVECRILASLRQRPIRAWTRAQLLDRMYDDHRAVNDRTVDSHVANLRKKLQSMIPGSECIESVYGIGYRFVES